jgi:ribosomal protein S18 acetylase RimI-like enzyme
MRMHPNDLLRIQQATESFKYHSFHYVDEHDIVHYQVVHHTTDALLIRGIHPSQQKPHIHFFVNNLESLIETLKPYPNHLIEFVPKAWMSSLEHQGFISYAVLRDYWYTYTDTRISSGSYTLATPNDIEAIMLLTQSRTGSSRAFSGEQEAVVRAWVQNQVEGVDDACVLIYKQDEIDGALMVGLYGEAEKRTLWVRMIVVKASKQNQGIGQKLLNQALDYGQKHHAKRAFLMADDLNENALYLYKKVGFQPNINEEQIDMITK